VLKEYLRSEMAALACALNGCRSVSCPAIVLVNVKIEEALYCYLLLIKLATSKRC
jgi:hypothetical protein